MIPPRLWAISVTGAGLWTNRIIMPGSTLELHIPPSATTAPLDLKARVVWCQPHTEGGFVRARMGIEFLDMTDALKEELGRIVGA